MSADPIMIDCEGSGSDASYGYCPMCGIVDFAVDRSAEFTLIAAHQRKDLLAMIERGDFAP